MSSTTRYKMPKVKLLHLLEELKANSVKVASLCIPPKSSKISIQGMMESTLDMNTIPGDLSELIAASPTGAILFWGHQHRYLIMPPFPISEQRSSSTCEIEPLHALLHKELLIALVLVRLGEYAIGVYRGDQLLSSKVGTGMVHARHRQGGSSSHRFERHREKQMETLFTRVCIHAREQLEPHVHHLDYIVYGGTRETILDFRKQCHYLHELDRRTLDLLLDTKEPKQSGLAEAIQEAWSSRVIQW
jgi:peptide subunit release factor 1 (eRF1)